ncbi:unnamed protein product [Diplocarpon coronariae]|nr:hypothetical protein JHW43_003241 [Diplocarpon mali]
MGILQDKVAAEGTRCQAVKKLSRIMSVDAEFRRASDHDGDSMHRQYPRYISNIQRQTPDNLIPLYPALQGVRISNVWRGSILALDALISDLDLGLELDKSSGLARASPVGLES